MSSRDTMDQDATTTPSSTSSESTGQRLARAFDRVRKEAPSESFFPDKSTN